MLAANQMHRDSSRPARVGATHRSMWVDVTEARDRARVRGTQILWAEPTAEDLANDARRAEIAATYGHPFIFVDVPPTGRHVCALLGRDGE